MRNVKRLIAALSLVVAALCAGTVATPSAGAISNISTPSGMGSCGSGGATDSCDLWVSSLGFGCYNYWIHTDHNWISQPNSAYWHVDVEFEWACANPHVIGQVMHYDDVDSTGWHVYAPDPVHGYLGAVSIEPTDRPETTGWTQHTLLGGTGKSYAVTYGSATVAPGTFTSGRTDSFIVNELDSNNNWQTWSSGGWDTPHFNSYYVVYNQWVSANNENVVVFNLR